jgi:hypothetical protein
MSTPNDLDERLIIFQPKWWVILFFLFFLVAASFLWAFYSEMPIYLKSEAIYLNSEGFDFLRAKINGFLLEVQEEGKKIEKGELIVKVQDPESKKIWEGKSQIAGEVVQTRKEKGEWVFERETIALIENSEGNYRFFCFLPFEEGQLVEEGMQVLIQEFGINSGNQGYHTLRGNVVQVSPFVISHDRLMDLLGDENLIQFFTHGEPVVEVQIEPLEKDLMKARSLSKVVIILSSRSMISYLIPIFHKHRGQQNK